MYNKQEAETGGRNKDDKHRDNALETRTRRGKKKEREGISGKGIELKKPAWIDMKKELVRITKELKRAEKAMEPN